MKYHVNVEVIFKNWQLPWRMTACKISYPLTWNDEVTVTVTFTKNLISTPGLMLDSQIAEPEIFYSKSNSVSGIKPTSVPTALVLYT